MDVRRSTKKIKIDKVEYTIMTLHHDLAWETWDVVAGPITKVAAALQEADNPVVLIQGLLEALPSRDFLHLIRVFGEYISYTDTDGTERRLDSSEKIAIHFQDRYGQELGLLAHAILHNYASFGKAKESMTGIFEALASTVKS